MNLILFKYILKHYIYIFFATLFALAAIVMLFDMIELLRTAAKRENIAFINIVILALLKSPQMIHILLPFVTLLSGIIFFLKYSASSELIIMRSVGMSVWNFLTPIIAFIFLLTKYIKLKIAEIKILNIIITIINKTSTKNNSFSVFEIAFIF